MKRIFNLLLCVAVLSWTAIARADPAATNSAGLVQLVYVTPEYSNAVFKALLPYFNDFVRRLNLPLHQPIVESQVSRFIPCPFAGYAEGRLILTNGVNLLFSNGVVDGFRSPSDYIEFPDFSNLEKYCGASRLTQQEAVQMAERAIADLGYKLQDLTFDWPLSVWGPGKKGTNVIPFFEVKWEEPTNGFFTSFDIDGRSRRVVGMHLSVGKIRRPDPKVDIVPQINSNYWRRVQERALPTGSTNKPSFSTMSARTNAPARLEQPKLIDAGSPK